MTYDSEYFRRRAASSFGDQGDDAEVCGHLALALAALERRRRGADAAGRDTPPVDDKPILLQD